MKALKIFVVVVAVVSGLVAITAGSLPLLDAVGITEGAMDQVGARLDRIIDILERALALAESALNQ